ncbi:hypothetical protein KIW84_075051 [Lathyrus oleraceus]|uniref:ATP synthase protein MI25 n=1 Tax=Pisum sativum TaxID=3888 RepID=A0A9D4VVG9_PEA|nr:hypothetical protein KIW84_075051 [Pisum sativum]
MMGQSFASLVSTVAAAESAIGLAIFVITFQVRGTIAVEFINSIQGFIIFNRKSLGNTFKVTLDGRIQAIQEESQQFPNPNKVVPPESNEQQRLLKIREEMFLVDTGPGTPRNCMQDEPTGVPISRATRFENKVGFLDLVAGESLIKKKILERLFLDLVAGESLIKERVAARFNDLVGSTDVVAGEPLLLLPRRLRQKRAWMKLNKIC